MQCGFAMGLFTFLFDLSLILRLRIYSIIFFHSIWSSTNILLVQSCVQTRLLLEFFILPSLLSVVFPFLPNPLMCPQNLPSSHIPQTEDSTQLLVSTDASHSTVTNGMWAQSCLPCPAPFLSQWMDPSTRCSESDSDLWRTYSYKHVSQSLDPVYEDVCTFITLPFSIVSLWFYVSGRVSLAVLRSEICTHADCTYS